MHFAIVAISLYVVAKVHWCLRSISENFEINHEIIVRSRKREKLLFHGWVRLDLNSIWKLFEKNIISNSRKLDADEKYLEIYLYVSLPLHSLTPPLSIYIRLLYFKFIKKLNSIWLNHIISSTFKGEKWMKCWSPRFFYKLIYD